MASKFIPGNAQATERGMQAARRAHIEQSLKSEIEEARRLIVDEDKAEEGLQILKDNGISAKHAADILLKFSFEAMAKQAAKEAEEAKQSEEGNEDQ